MAFCTECGFKLPDDAVFCPNCGAPVRGAPEAGAADHEGSHESASPFEKKGASTYGYPHSSAAKAVSKHSGGGKVAAIVISIVVVLFAAAGYLLDKAVSKNSFTGYWESCAVEVNGQEKDSYFGKDIKGLFGVEIRDDKTASMCSAFTGQVFSGKWERDGDDITISGSGEIYYLTKKDDRIYLFNNGLYIVYKQVDGDIAHPSVPHGSLSRNGGNGTVLPSPGTDSSSDGTVDGSRFSVEITGAEAYQDEDGKDAMRVYFTFTNHDSNAQAAWDTLDFYTGQDGKELQGESEQEDTDTGKLLSARIRPEVTVQCCYSFAYNPAGSEVTFAIFGWDKGQDGGVVSQKFAPGSLPGAPEPLAIKVVPEPKWTTSLPSEGMLNDVYGVAVRGAERVADESGADFVRVLYSFTNGSEHKVSLEEASNACTYQDGVALEPVEVSKPTETDEAFSKAVPSGATVQVSRVYRLRNTTSQIEAELELQGSYDAVGQTYSVR